MTIQQFRRSPELTAGLEAALANPTLQKAFFAIREDAIIKSVPPQTPGVHHDTTIAHELHKQMGTMFVFECLEAMTHHATKPPEQEGEYEWATKDLKPFGE